MNAAVDVATLRQEAQQHVAGLQSSRVALLNEGIVRHLYQSGFTIDEVAAIVGATYRAVWKFMQRVGIERRVAAKRDQRGEKNTNWKGDAVGYKAAHDRVRSVRGDPCSCEHCGCNERTQLEWANVSGAYHDPNDYIGLCVRCHRRWDAKRRKKVA